MKTLFPEIPVIKGKRITLHKIRQKDAASLKELAEDPKVYRYLPTFLFEKKYSDISYVIRHLYDECLEDSLILGIFMNETPDDGRNGDCNGPADKSSSGPAQSGADLQKSESFCGIIELYGYREPIHKISVGYRLLKRCWGAGIASGALGLLIDYLLTETNIEIITASTMIENQASARVLMKNGFELITHATPEDWGYETPTIADKWIR